MHKQLMRGIASACFAVLALAEPAVAQGSPPTACPKFAFSRTFTNLTGKTVQGLHLALHGPREAGRFYTGPENPFGPPAFEGLGPDGSYRVRFGGANVTNGQAVRVAFCIDRPASDLVPLGSSPAQTWIVEPNPGEEEPAPEQRLPALGARWAPVAAGTGIYQVQVELTNAEPSDVALVNLEWTRLVQPLPVEDLSWSQLDAAASWQSLGSALTVLASPHEAGPSRSAFTLPASFQFDEPGVLVFRFAAAEPGNSQNVIQGVGQVAIASLLRPVFLETRALQVASGKLGVPAPALSVLHSSEGAYPLQGQAIFPFKVGSAAGAIASLILDPSGNELFEHQLESQEAALRTALYGRLDPALAQRLSSPGPGAEAPIPVALWLLAPPDGDGPAAPEKVHSQEELDAYHDAVDTHLAARTAALTAPVVSRLQSMGYPAHADAFAPIIYTTLPPSAIQQAATWPEVETVYEAKVYANLLNIVRPVVRADLLHAANITGTGIELGQVEVNGGTAAGNPYLPGVTPDTGFSCLDPHATGVAGIIVSTHATHKGIAPAASLYAAGGCSGAEQAVKDASDRALNWGALTLNASLGANSGTAPTTLDRFYDAAVRGRRRSIVVAAGNEAGTCNSGNGRVTTPARAYNIITVGNYDDRNTLGWRDDVMSSCSSFVDPTSTNGDREKPEVSAPGTSILSTTNASPWTGNIGSGTSYAAPVVTGGTGLLFQRDLTLGAWPEAVKAILMTTAVHNVEGPTVLSDKDGAGGIVLDHAVATVDNSRWGKNNSYLCTAAASVDVQTIALGAGRRTRVTLVWSTPDTYTNYASRPAVDLEMEVIDPAGNVVAGSYSLDNTYEIVDFLALSTGNHKIRVRKTRCDLDPKYLAWAWWQDVESIIDGAGWDGQGAGIDVYDLNGNGAPEVLLMAYDAPPGQNSFRYKIGWDADNLGRTSSWSAVVQENGVGWEGQGASLNLFNLDGNARPEMILMAYDNPPGQNSFRYKIGWNLSTAGTTATWTGPIQIPGVGWEGQGAGVEIANLDNNPLPEMILVGYDNPPGQNSFRYMIGWNLSNTGGAAAWTGPTQIGGVGWEGQGAGVTIANMDGNARPEMVLMAYDNPPGANTFRYLVGWNLGLNGTTANWSNVTLVEGIGWDADGADPRLFDIDNDGVQELFLMCYDDPWGPNTFRYRVIEP